MGERRGKKSRRSYGISDHFFVERIYTSGGAAAVFFSRIGKLSRESNERASSIARAFAGKSIYSGAALIRVRIMLRVEFVSNCGRKIRFAAALREYKRTYYRWPIGNWPGMSARAHSRARAHVHTHVAVVVVLLAGMSAGSRVLDTPMTRPTPETGRDSRGKRRSGIFGRPCKNAVRVWRQPNIADVFGFGLNSL